jgi:hypothetical protein
VKTSGTPVPHESARGHVTDCPWWAPLTAPGGHATHPHAPTVQFGELVSDRYVQAYGGPVDGRSASRSTSSAATPLPFDQARAHALYKALFGETPLDTARQAKPAQEIGKYQGELHGSAAWARDASLLQIDKTGLLRIHPRGSS